jgi:hypothetical protein
MARIIEWREIWLYINVWRIGIRSFLADFKNEAVSRLDETRSQKTRQESLDIHGDYLKSEVDEQPTALLAPGSNSRSPPS